LILILLPAIFGLKKGLIKSIFTYISIITGIILAVKFNSGFLLVVKPFIKDPRLAQVVIFIVIILTVYLLAIFLASKISKLNFISETIDKVGGFVFGGLKGILFLSIMLIVFDNYSFIPKNQKNNSFAFPYVIQAAPATYNALKNLLPFSKRDFNDIIGIDNNDSTKTKTK
jgi:uncharacterized membrane protein required for colicin V production